MKFSSFLFLMIATIFALSGCKKEEANNPASELTIFDVSNDTDWDYWVVGKDGDNLFVNVQNDKPTSVFYTPDPKQDGYAVFFDEDGFPDKLVIDDYIFLFANFSGTKTDVTLISPDGTISNARDVETNINWDESSLKSTSKWSTWFTWTGHAIGGVACAVGVAAGPATFGVAWIVTGIGCGATAVSVLATLAPDDLEILGLPSTLVGAIAAAVGCVGSPDASCATGLASAASSLMGSATGYLEEHSDAVRVAIASLLNGDGDVQITLTWDNTADLDLYVIDPYGVTICWDTLRSYEGILDKDDNDGYGPENVYWPYDRAPYGNYAVYIHFYPHDDRVGYPNSTKYTVLISAFGHDPKIFNGTIDLHKYVAITSFDEDGFYKKSAILKSTFSIPKSKNFN